jgi:hypothetical protein
MYGYSKARRIWDALSGRLGSILILVFVCGLLPVLYFGNPQRGGVFPPCPFRFLTGLKCPGCGTLRALHQLLHGNIVGAFQLNPLMVLCMPLAVWFVVSHVSVLVRGRSLRGVRVKPSMIWTILGIIMSYGILRNIFPVLGG